MPSPTATARPSTPPTTVCTSPLSPTDTNRNSAVSMPSRVTAMNATVASAIPPPALTASATWLRRWPPIVAAWRRIQNSIHVSTPQARSIAAPS
jgi:hypothetical protein